MRAVLVDWLVDVHWKFKVRRGCRNWFWECASLAGSPLTRRAQMLPETLFLAIYIIDKFLTKQEVDRRSLQLVRGGEQGLR